MLIFHYITGQNYVVSSHMLVPWQQDAPVLFYSVAMVTQMSLPQSGDHLIYSINSIPPKLQSHFPSLFVSHHISYLKISNHIICDTSSTRLHLSGNTVLMIRTGNCPDIDLPYSWFFEVLKFHKCLIFTTLFTNGLPKWYLVLFLYF